MEKSRFDSFLVRLLSLPLPLLFFFSFRSASGATMAELDAAMSALRSAGYNLFPNAVDTSDLRYRLVTAGPNTNFTIFAPPDRFLFTLDFTAPSADHYYLSLLRHVAPFRLTSGDLLGLARRRHGGHGHPAIVVPTLAPNHTLQISLTPEMSLMVSGVRVSYSDVYLGQDLAVHGLNRTLGECSSSVPREFHAYPRWGHGSGSDLIEAEAGASPGRHVGGGGHSHNGRNRRQRKHQHRDDEHHRHGHITNK
ncbi:hypothetical protein SAY86_001894 [Trapa natans]|uniref:FAS1 domain-containing protein n=1 Tax=Trapa natans TaxID=22666 RepID=A0AAN7LGY4_TRANT|nr:hypothetical protein SAY86_001894 [Trapa natans]